MYILGISAFYHDSAASLIYNGKIIAAAQEERFSRIKHDASFPEQAIRFCLEQGGIETKEVEQVVFYEKPFVKFERLLETYLAFAPRGIRSFIAAMPVWIKEKLFQKRLLLQHLADTLTAEIDWSKRLFFSEHHLSHSASAFFPSPYQRAAVLTLDGVGEWATASVAIGNGNKLNIVKELHFPHSLGLLYSAFTYYLGFKVNSGEYKVMGLAPYGKPIYADLIRQHLIKVADDGSFVMDMDYFDYATGLTMTNKKFARLFGGPRRKPEAPLTQRDMDLAASIQKVTEDIVVMIATHIAEETGEENLCLAGGVMLNCVANSKILDKGIFKNIWVQPAAGDAGCAIGAALSVWYLQLDKPREIILGQDGMQGALLGPQFSAEQIEVALSECGAIYQQVSDDELFDLVATALERQKAIGWMQGRMEFGPRALGNRSIIADPRWPAMQKQLNLKVKYRESFRPFAPSVLKECVSDWFERVSDSPYMLFVADVAKSKRKESTDQTRHLFGLEQLSVQRSAVPAITHVDYSARLQTVEQRTNPRYHQLISHFYKKTGCPMLVNTSFNIRGEPIVCTPQDAFNCFMGTELDVLVVDNFILYKTEQTTGFNQEFKKQYELD